MICSLTVLLLSLVVDCLCYGKLVNVYYNFLEFNFLSDLGSFYGTHPWHWYLSQGLVVLLGSHIVPLLYAAWKGIEPYFLVVIAWTVFVYRYVGQFVRCVVRQNWIQTCTFTLCSAQIGFVTLGPLRHA